jgi:hypothetical protein
MRFRYKLLFIALLLSSTGMAQTRKYSNEFMNLGVGSRAFGMSGAVIASSNDIYSGYWNPAGLAHMEGKFQAALMHAEYFGSIAKYDYGAAAYKINDSSTLALSIIRFGVDDIPNTTELIDAGGNVNYDRITLFSAVDYAFLVSYAKRSRIRGLSIGANAKVIHRSIGDFAKSWGFGVDFGAQYRRGAFTFAAMGRDLSTTFNAWSYSLDQSTIDAFTQTGNEIPENALEITLPRFVLGAAHTAKLSSKIGLQSEINLSMNTDGQRNTLISSKAINIDPYAGIELDYRKIVYLRAGAGNIQKVTDFDLSESYSMQPNFGVGIRIKNVCIDYALTDIGNLSDAIYSNVFSLKIEI